jgi:hypothetical protein
MKRFAILALVGFCAFTADPLQAAEASAQAPAATGPCGIFDCSRLPAPMAKAMQNLPPPPANAPEFKLQDLNSLLRGLCPDGKCPIELPAK